MATCVFVCSILVSGLFRPLRTERRAPFTFAVNFSLSLFQTFQYNYNHLITFIIQVVIICTSNNYLNALTANQLFLAKLLIPYNY